MWRLLRSWPLYLFRNNIDSRRIHRYKCCSLERKKKILVIYYSFVFYSSCKINRRKFSYQLSLYRYFIVEKKRFYRVNIDYEIFEMYLLLYKLIDIYIFRTRVLNCEPIKERTYWLLILQYYVCFCSDLKRQGRFTVANWM